MAAEAPQKILGPGQNRGFKSITSRPLAFVSSVFSKKAAVKQG